MSTESKPYESRCTDNLKEAEEWQKEGFKPHIIAWGKIFMRKKREPEFKTGDSE